MNPCEPDWNFEVVSNQMKPLGEDNELVELLWQNGQVVLHSQTQTQRKPNLNPNNEPPQVEKQSLSVGGSYANSSNLIQDDESVSWIQDPMEASFEKEFYSNFFSGLPQSGPMEVDKLVARQIQEEKMVEDDPRGMVSSSRHQNVNHSVVSGLGINAMRPPGFEFHDAAQQNESSGDLGKVVSFSQSAAPLKGELGSCMKKFDRKRSRNLIQGEVRECSVMTVGSSHCGSNQVACDLDMSRASSNGVGTTTGLSPGNLKDDVRKVISPSERGKTETIELTVTSCSGGSGSSFNGTSKQSAGDNSLKRKSRDAGESEFQSEAAEFESAELNMTSQRPGTCRRSRAAEVHNLSERRRRDRINEKMKALQDLIPHCNKTDKASMLDEAIEYLKSLQLQLQVMWMGSGMAPMMFPGVHHYMSRMSMGMGPSSLPSVANPMHFPRIPLVDQSMSMAQAAQNQAVMCQAMMLNPVNYQNQMQNPNFSNQYAHFMGFHPMQTNSQPMNMLRFGSPTVQTQVVSPPGSSPRPFPGGAATDKAHLTGKTG